MLLFRVFVVRRTCGHFLAAGLSDRVGIGAIAAIASLPAFNRYLIPHLDGIPFPSETLKLLNATEFELPIRHLAVRIFGIHKDMSMRIRPVHFRDGSRHGHRFIFVVLRGKGMMRLQRKD